MLTKLRRKFILITMLLVSLVLVAVFAASLISTYQSSYESVQGSLRMAVTRNSMSSPFPQVGGNYDPGDLATDRSNGNEPAPPGEDVSERFDSGGLNDEDKREGRMGLYIPTYSVVVSSDLQVIDKNNSTLMDEDLASYAISQAAGQEEDSGRLKDIDLYYLKAEDPSGEIRMAFADVSIVRDTVLSTMRTSLLIGAGALLALFLISLVLSRYALRPVEKAWEQQSRFVADASHELKTPLTVLLANNNILLSRSEKTVEEQRKWIESSQDEAQRMEGLVNDLLLLAQIEQSATDSTSLFEHHEEQINMSELANKSTLQYEAIAFEKSISLESDITPDITLVGDPDQLERLLRILLDNACKYSGTGGNVVLSLFKQKDAVVVRVTNTGDTIPAEEIEHIFERFYRSDKARSHEETSDSSHTTSGSYGLGLSIAQAIVESHHGTITATSTNNLTTFEVRL